MTTDLIALDVPLHLIATDAGQLQAAHAKMLEWCALKIERCDVDLSTEEAALSVAIDNGWLKAPFQRRVSQIKRRRVFYEKIQGAVQAGYAIVPNFEMNIFAIRTDKDSPKSRRWDTVHRQRNAVAEEEAKRLPPGEGEYKNANVRMVQTDSYKKTEKSSGGHEYTETHLIYESNEFSDFAFPVALAKPELMTATQRALALKIFDQVGVADARVPRSDPFILGRIKSHARGGADITFFIGWYFDPSRL